MDWQTSKYYKQQDNQTETICKQQQLKTKVANWQSLVKHTLNLSDKIEGVTNLYLGTSERSLS